MKKTLFDGRAMQGSSRAIFHGGGEYTKFIFKAAIERGYQFDVVLFKNLHTDGEIEEILSRHKEISVNYVTSKNEVYELIERENYQKFYSALPAFYSDYKGSTQLVGVIHGLRAAELPWDFYRYKYETNWSRSLLGWVISHCSQAQKYLKQKHIEQSRQLLKIPNAKFITVSNHSKHALLAFYPELKAENIQVYYSPFSVKKIEKNTNKDDFFLMVSGNRYEKNVYRAVRVFDKLFSDGRLSDKRVVITGCSNQSFWKKLKNRDKFELLPYVSTEELETLYERAFCFVYPSLNEGFGYPPLKAMAYGTPIIASSATSIPEICYDAACYFSPTNEDDLATRILTVTYDSDFRMMLAEKGICRVQKIQEKQNKEIDDELIILFG